MRHSSHAAALVLAMAAMDPSLPAPKLRERKQRKSYTPVPDAATKREIAEHNAGVEMKRQLKLLRKP